MTTLLAVFLLVGLAITGMAVGAIAGGRCLRGSCGGLANFQGEGGRSLCEVCDRRTPECGTTPSSTDEANSESPNEAEKLSRIPS